MFAQIVERQKIKFYENEKLEMIPYNLTLKMIDGEIDV
jgi:hypothetical protein